MIPVLGVDPGKGGGFAVIDPDGNADAIKFPRVFPGDDQSELDYAQLEAYFGDLRLHGCSVAFVERLVKYAGNNQSGSSSIVYGFNAGAVRGILEAQRWDIHQVIPIYWMRHFTDRSSSSFPSKTAWKNHLKDIAISLFPDVKVTLAISDALLIAEYGRTQLNT